VPTRHELIQLVKYWQREALEIEYWWFLFRQVGSSETRRRAFALRRVDRIWNLLGEEEVQQAVDGVYAEFGKNTDAMLWDVFLRGDEGSAKCLVGGNSEGHTVIVCSPSAYLQTADINDAEVRADANVAVVNERFAAEFGSPADAIDHDVSIGKSTRWKIIGVVKGMDYMTETMDTVHSNQIFIPAHDPGGFVSTFVVRVNGRAEDSLPAIRDTIRSVDTRFPYLA
jgi:MacB-like periplasmic core domain